MNQIEKAESSKYFFGGVMRMGFRSPLIMGLYGRNHMVMKL